MQHPALVILQFILVVSILSAWGLAFVRASLTYNSESAFRRSMKFSTRLYGLVIALLIFFIAAVLLSYSFNLIAVFELVVLSITTILLLIMSVHLLRLNTQLSRIMKAHHLSARWRFNIYQIMAIALIALISIRIFI